VAEAELRAVYSAVAEEAGRNPVQALAHTRKQPH
jgi:hypothetical protein